MSTLRLAVTTLTAVQRMVGELEWTLGSSSLPHPNGDFGSTLLDLAAVRRGMYQDGLRLNASGQQRSLVDFLR